MQRFKEAEHLVQESAAFIETKIGIFPDVLIKMILEYLKTPLFIWKDLIFPGMKISKQDAIKNSHYPPEVVEQFKIAFLNTLLFIEISPTQPINLTIPCFFTRVNDEMSFANPFKALEHILFHSDILNLEYFTGMLAQANKSNLEFLNRQWKELLLLVPGTEEHVITPSDSLILSDMLGLGGEDLQLLYPTRLVKDFDPIIKYLTMDENKHYSLVTTVKNTYARHLIEEVKRCQKDAEEYENRLGGEKDIVNMLEVIGLFPKVLNKIVAQYVVGVDIISLTEKVIEQLNSLKIKYDDRFKQLVTKPQIILILEETLQAILKGKSIRFYWDGYNPSATSGTLKYEYKAIKALQRLIKGVRIQYGMTEEVFEPFEAKNQTASFSLLKFFKGFPQEQAASQIDDFIKDLLELANTHTPVKVNKYFLGSEFKTFSSITCRTSLAERMLMEKELNKKLRAKGAVKRAVNYITVDEKSEDNLTLYVRSNAQHALNTLKKFIGSRIHLSPLFIHKFLENFKEGIYREKWHEFTITKRGKVIKRYLSSSLAIPTKNFSVVKQYGRYGYQLYMRSDCFTGVQSRLFSQGKIAGSNPTGIVLLNTIRLIENELKQYQAGKDSNIDKVFNFVNTFRNSFKEINQICDSEEALTKAVDFLQSQTLKLQRVLSDTKNLSGESQIPFQLQQELVSAEKSMLKLHSNISRLISQLATGEMVLTLSSLPGGF